MCGGGGSTKIKDTASQKALASIAAQRFNLYQQYYVPLENEFIASVNAMNDPEAFKNVEGFVNAVQQPQYQASRRALERQAFAQGMDPTSGQYQARAGMAQEAQARGMSTGTTQALSGQLDRYYQGMQNIVAMGQGQAGQAIAGLGDVGELAQKRGIAAAQQSFQKGQGTANIFGTALGAGAGLYMGNRGT
jgi:hypothetical protein